MPADAILTYSDYADEPVPVLPEAGLTYTQWIRAQYRAYRGQDAPAMPQAASRTVAAFVDCGRWVWQCGDCLGAFPAEPGQLAICARCGDDWVALGFPPDRDQIEAELLRQPGRRLYAPVRHWLPGQTLDHLRDRTARAIVAQDGGQSPVRALSIGATRTWLVGEILRAEDKNTYETELFKDLAGRNGRVDLENALRIKTGTQHATQPFTDITQDYLGLPQRATDPAAAGGRLYYHTGRNRLRANDGNGWNDLGVPGLVALTDGASIAWDLDAAPNAVVTLGGNRTLAAPTNPRDGFLYLLSVQQDATGSRTLGFGDDAFTATPVPSVSGGSGSGAVVGSITVDSNGDITSISWTSGGTGYAANDVLVLKQGATVGSLTLQASHLSGGVLQNLSGLTLAGLSVYGFGAIGGTPVLSTAAGSIDLLGFMYRQADGRMHCGGIRLGI